MLPLISVRRLNAIKIPYSFISYSLYTKSTIPISQFHSNSPKPQQGPENLDSDAVSKTLSLYSNDWKRALDFFNWVETQCGFEHTAETLNRMIDILGKFFEFDLSWELIHKMRKNSCAIPNHVTFRVLFKRYICAHLVNEAVTTYDYRLEEFSLKDETSYCNLIDALCEYKHVMEAEELCFGKNMNGVVEENTMINARNRTKIYNMILRGWLKLGWWSKCREFWEEMDKRGVRKDLHSYSIYMDISCKSKKPWKAVKLYKEMKSRGIKLDVVAYNTVIHAIGLSKGVDFSVGVYREMRELGCQPNVVTCNTVIKLLCENGRFQEAYNMVDEMLDKGITPDVISYHSIFACLEKPKEMLWLFDRMHKDGVQPRMDTYVMLMRKFGRWGFLRPVFVVWNKMEELGVSPNEFAYNALIDALIDKGMLEEAKKYDEEMVAKGLSPKPRKELAMKLEEKLKRVSLLEDVSTC